MRCQGITQFYLQPTRLSTHRMTTRFPSRSWSSFTEPGGIEGLVGVGTTTASKQSAYTSLRDGNHSYYLFRP